MSSVVDGSKAAVRRQYLNSLLAIAQTTAQQSALGLGDLRAAARAMVQEQTFPSTRDEQWRFTDLSSLLDRPLAAAQTSDALVAQAQGRLAKIGLETGARLVFVNGFYAAALSRLQPGISVFSQTAASELAQVPGGNEVFTALNTAGFAEAATIRIGKNQAVEQPVQVVYLTLGDRPQLVQPRCLVVAEAGSSLTLLEEFYGEGTGLTNSVSEVVVQQNAEVNHLRLQHQDAGTVCIGKTAVSQARDSRYRHRAFDFGAGISRHNLEIFQTGPNTETQLHGLSAVGDRQVADTHTLVALNHPHGRVDQLQKNIVDDRAHAVFNGRVYVPRPAQLTDAAQLNRNLLLSSGSRVDTKPELDIVADDVKCAHGATVSQLAADELFYLQSRGISQEQAQRLLIYAFAMEIVEPVSIDSLRQRLTQYIQQWTV